MDLNLVRLIFMLELESELSDRYALFGFRPFFVDALRKVAACNATGNEPCVKGGRCSYHNAFSQTLSADPSAVQRYQKPSLPFIFDVPVLPLSPKAGTRVELGLTLVGSAVAFCREYIGAMGAMLADPGFCRRVDASLLKVESEGYGRVRSLVATPAVQGELTDLPIMSLRGLSETAVMAPDAVTLRVVTPLRLMTAGKASRQFSYSLFIRTLFRRISSLVYYYGGEEADLDFKLLAERSLAITPSSADFKWVEWPGRQGGLVGTGTFTGDMTDYHPFLVAGEYLHGGKGASFGLGQYCVADGA